MDEANLADLYQSANISLPTDVFLARESAFSNLSTSLNTLRVVELVRLYFSFGQMNKGFEWFTEAFRATDRGFSLAGRPREASVLAEGLLLNSLINGNAFAGLAVLCASLCGKRGPAVNTVDVGTFHTLLGNIAIRKPRSGSYGIDFGIALKHAAGEGQPAAAASPLSLGSATQQSTEEPLAASKPALPEVLAIMAKIAADLTDAREEIGMLWWLVGGWSRSLNRSFAGIGSPVSSISAGFDLADLSLTMQGPYAAEAMLARVLGNGKKHRKNLLSLGEVGDSVSPATCDQLALSPNTELYADLCPVSNCLRKSVEIGRGTSWHESFQRTSHLDVSLELTPLELAQQAMRERLLLRNLGG